MEFLEWLKFQLYEDGYFSISKLASTITGLTVIGAVVVTFFRWRKSRYNAQIADLKIYKRLVKSEHRFGYVTRIDLKITNDSKTANAMNVVMHLDNKQHMDVQYCNQKSPLVLPPSHSVVMSLNGDVQMVHATWEDKVY